MKQNNLIPSNGYLVGNYTQYLNALDFKRYDTFNKHHIIFILCTQRNVYKEIVANVNIAEWDYVGILYNRFLIFLTQLRIPIISNFASVYNEYWVYKKVLKKIGKIQFQYFAIGNYFYPTYRSISNNVNKSKVVILDDGANLINSIENLKQDEENNYLTKTKTGTLLFSRLSVFYEPSIAYFGTYRKLRFRPNDEVIYNNRFDDVKDIKVVNGCYFIGQKIYDKMIEFQHYINIISQIKKELFIEDFYYLPHRMETRKEIDKIGNYFKILSPGEPIEYYLLKQRKSPEFLISYYSSALLNIKLMNIKSVNCIAIKAGELSNSNKSLKRIYDYYMLEGINIIEK